MAQTKKAESVKKQLSWRVFTSNLEALPAKLRKRLTDTESTKQDAVIVTTLIGLGEATTGKLIEAIECSNKFKSKNGVAASVRFRLHRLAEEKIVGSKIVD